MPTVLVRHGEQLPCQRLYHQPCHEVLGGVLLRQDEEDSGLLRRKLLGVGGAVEAQHLLQLRVQEGVEPGQHRGHDGGHGLFGGIQRCTGKPPGLVYVRQSVHQKREPVFAANAGGRQQLLHQLEYGHDVSALCGAFAVRRQELRQQKHHGGQQALRRIVEVGVLAVVRVAVWRHDGLGQYLGVLLRFGTGGKIAGRPCLIHVVVDEGHEIIAIRARGVTQIHHRNMIAIIPRCHRAVVAGEVTLGIQCQEAHTAGAGIFQVGVQEIGSLAHAGCADHKTMHIVLIHQCGDAMLAAGAAQHQSLRFR